MKKIYYLLLLLFMIDSSTAQTNSEEAPMYIHPAFSNGFVNAASPNVWSMIKYGDADVDLFTGTLGLSIPIYTYEDSDFTIPVSIGYSSSGYKPNIQTGILGLGWYLNCGGSITREINGIADNTQVEMSNKMRGFADESWTMGSFVLRGFSGIFQNGLSENPTYDFLYSGSPGQEYTLAYKEDGSLYETEPDQFHFKFLGYSGSFIIQPGLQCSIYDSSTPSGELTINTNSSLSFFKITTGDHYQYFFEQTEPCEAFYADSSSETSSKYDTNWLLTRIVAPTGAEALFSYRDNDNKFNSCTPRISNDITYVRNRYAGDTPVDTDDYEGTEPIPFIDPTPDKISICDLVVNIVQQYYLESITIDGKVTIQFSYEPKDEETQDYSMYNSSSYNPENDRINEISVYAAGHTESLKTCHFEYNTSDGSPVTFLTGIAISGEGKYKMDYYNQHDDFPGINTFAIDWLGYYNKEEINNPTSGDISHGVTGLAFYPKITAQGEIIPESNTNRNPDFEATRYGMLQKITYPTGGASSFEYELNTYRKEIPGNSPMATTNPIDRNTGGVRISRIYNSSGQTAISRTFSYTDTIPYRSSGILFWKPRVYINENVCMEEAGGAPYGYHIMREHVSTLNNFPYSKNPHIGYSRVLETVKDEVTNKMTQIEHFYYALYRNGYQDQIANATYYGLDGFYGSIPWTLTSNTANTELVRCQVQARSNLWGKPQETVYYDSAGRKLYKEFYEYDQYTPQESEISYPSIIANTMCRYIVNAQSVYNSATTKYYYSATGSLIDSVRTRNILNDYGRLAITETSDSKNNTLREYCEYFSGAPAYLENHFVKRGDRLIDATRYNYYAITPNSEEGDQHLYLPESLEKAEISISETRDNLIYHTQIDYDLYDDLGHPLQTTDKSGKSTCYIWGYNGLYVVARIDNATFSQIASYLPSAIAQKPLATNLDALSGVEATLRGLQGVQVTTYEYEPLVGITRITDPFGRETSYEYDSQGRLIYVFDDAGDKTNEYIYHIINQ